jgi:hypothetical protein
MLAGAANARNRPSVPPPKEIAMTGQVHWLPLAVVLLSALPFAYVWLREWREERKLRVEPHFVRCRSRGNLLAQCILVSDRKSGVPMGIRSCSALRDPQDVRCGKTCLPLFAASPDAKPRWNYLNEPSSTAAKGTVVQS